MGRSEKPKKSYKPNKVDLFSGVLSIGLQPLFFATIILVGPLSIFFSSGGGGGQYGHRTATTIGTVIRSEIQTRQNANTTLYNALADYEYRVGQETYVAGSSARGPDYTTNRSDVENVLAHYPLGEEVTVHYDPANPGDGITFSNETPYGKRQRAQQRTQDFLLWTTIPAFFFLGTIFYIACLLFPAMASSASGGVLIRERGHRISAKLPQIRHLVITAAICEALNILAIQSSFFSSSTSQQQQIEWALYQLSLAIAFLSIGWWGFKYVTGRWDLILDLEQQTLDIPKAFDRLERQIVSLNTITRITLNVERREEGRGDTKIHYLPTVYWLDEDDAPDATEQADTLAAWRLQYRAVHFTDWLRKQITEARGYALIENPESAVALEGSCKEF